MATVVQRRASVQQRIIGGIVGGAVFGLVMGVMGMFPMIAGLVGGGWM